MGIMIDKWDIDDKKAEAWIVKGKMQIRYHGSIHNIELSTVGLIPKDQYETRLKADLKAMLEEIQLEIEELDVSDVVPEYQDGAEETKEHIANMIEEKINSLKEN